MRKFVSLCYYLRPLGLAVLLVMFFCQESLAQTIAFENNYPTFKSGSESIKLSVKVNRPATVYFWLRNRIVNDISAEKIKSEGLRYDNEGENQSGVIHFQTGIQEHILSGLEEGNSYYLYMVPEEGSDLDPLVSIYNGNIQMKDRQVSSTYASNDVVTGYLTYFPESYYLEGDSDFPIIFSLHGDGSEGTNLESVKAVGLTRYIQNGNNLSAVVVSPQARYTDWNDQSQTYTELASFVDDMVEELPVDNSRVYLTGFSKGGKGTWEFAMNHPEKVSAIVPIAGFGNSNLACNIKDLPIWAFHNSGDNVVGVGGSRSLVEAVESCGGNPMFTVYNSSIHDSWTNTYNGSSGNNAIAWMMQHRTNAPNSITSVNIEEPQETFSIYPNPVTDVLEINKNTLSETNFLLSIYDSAGRSMMEAKTRIGTKRRLDLQKLPSGTYWLLIAGSQTSFRQIFIKK